MEVNNPHLEREPEKIALEYPTSPPYSNHTGPLAFPPPCQMHFCLRAFVFAELLLSHPPTLHAGPLRSLRDL